MSKPNLFIMVGLSGSGKSSTAKEIAERYNCVIVSSDNIRQRICPGGVRDQSLNDQVFNIFHKEIKQYLLDGKNVIADATNITIKSRNNIFRCVSDINCEKIAYVMTKPIQDCIDDDKKRKYSVTKNVIYKQARSFQIPFKEEGFDDIILKNNQKNQNPYFLSYICGKMYDFDQKTPYHNETLYEHCMTTKNEYLDMCAKGLFEKVKSFCPEYCYLGVQFHDVGKLFTQVFDDNGVAHYFNHAEFGSYYMLSHINDLRAIYNSNDLILMNLFTINYHMMPFTWNTEKANNKWKNKFGEEKYRFLLLFHECDMKRK